MVSYTVVHSYKVSCRQYVVIAEREKVVNWKNIQLLACGSWKGQVDLVSGTDQLVNMMKVNISHSMAARAVCKIYRHCCVLKPKGCRHPLNLCGIIQ